MKIKTVVGLASASALASIGAVGLSGSTAFGAAALHPPSVQDVGVIYPSPSPTGQLPAIGDPSLTVVGNCPSNLFGDSAVGFAFLSGNGVFYRIPPGAPPSMANGGNIEGTADLMYATPGVPPSASNMDGTPPSNPVDSGYEGHAHLWFGQNSNANGQSYFGETISFSGSATDGSTISITANPGSNTSAGPGNMNGWGKLKVTCTPATS